MSKLLKLLFIEFSPLIVANARTIVGQVIGGVRSTGASTGPHLHWGFYVHGLAVDPVPWWFEGVE